SVTVVGQEPLTVAAAETSVDGFDSWIREPLDDRTILARGDQDYVEVTQPLYGLAQDADLRVGFSTGPLNRAQRNAAMQILFRSGVFILLAVLLIAIVFARQNTALLKAEKARIEEEVNRLQRLSRFQDKQAAIGQLAAGVAHEIRNPLNAIGILAQRLRRECRLKSGQEEFEQFTNTMTSEIGRINGLLEEFLAFARPTSLTLAPVDISRLLEDVSQLFISQANDKGIALIVDSAAGLQFEGDVQHLQQAFANVVKNALEAVKRGDTITISAQSTDGATVIQVADTGQGIPPENLNRIFDLFYTTRNEGTGIGLALTHKIIADHGGIIEVDSTLGQGTTFKFTFSGGKT
ncbi:PAS domain-containing sensor histidine kinase, partial [Candidatus Neomarinimicrobiota bacterium]